MTNDNPDTKPVTISDWMAEERARIERCKALAAENRVLIFDALQQLGIASVEITFDGCGDSGQIEDISVDPESAPDLAEVNVRLKHGHNDAGDVKEVNLRSALEDMVFDLLGIGHAGWEINEGAYGEFTFDVGERTIALDYNERVERVAFSHHEF